MYSHLIILVGEVSRPRFHINCACMYIYIYIYVCVCVCVCVCSHFCVQHCDGVLGRNVLLKIIESAVVFCLNTILNLCSLFSKYTDICLFLSVAQQPSFGLGHFNVEIYRSRARTHRERERERERPDRTPLNE
jgi:hypothetical protein